MDNISGRLANKRWELRTLLDSRNELESQRDKLVTDQAAMQLTAAKLNQVNDRIEELTREILFLHSVEM